MPPKLLPNQPGSILPLGSQGLALDSQCRGRASQSGTLLNLRFAKRRRSLVAYPNSSRSSSAATASLRSFAYASSIGMSAALPGANPQSG